MFSDYIVILKIKHKLKITRKSPCVQKLRNIILPNDPKVKDETDKNQKTF